MIVSHFLGYSNFKIGFCIEKYKSSNFVLPSHYCFSCSGSFAFSYEFQGQLFSFSRNSILTEVSKIFEDFGESENHTNLTLLNFQIYDHE
jgi:hypothetical protein